MAVLTDIVSRVRLELGDQPKQFTKRFTGDAYTTDFNLAVKPIDIYTLAVYVNGSPVANPAGYTIEEDLGVIHFVHTPANNAAILVSGVQFRYFTDDDLCRFVNTAITQHVYNRTNGMGSQMTVGLIPAVEEYPLAILATIEALWALATDASFDIDITAPDGVNIPRSERYRQLTQTIQARWEQYKQLCSALNIGLWRIEMGTLRRVSRTTNKLIPVYMPQEIDDSRKPERVYIQNDLNGRTPTPSYADVMDITLYQGDSWAAEFDFSFDITGLEFKAQARTSPGSPSLYATFTVEVLDEATGRIRLSLAKSETEYLPARLFWDLQATSPTDDTYEQTFLRGQVFVTQEVTV